MDALELPGRGPQDTVLPRHDRTKSKMWLLVAVRGPLAFEFFSFLYLSSNYHLVVYLSLFSSLISIFSRRRIEVPNKIRIR